MSRMTSQYPERVFSTSAEERQRPLTERMRPSGASAGWMLAGMAALGLGAFAVYYFGPDLRRYLKIRNM